MDYSGDVMIGSQTIKQIFDIYRKLCGTLRYLLSNLHDWKQENSIAYKDLPMIDKYALYQLANVISSHIICIYLKDDIGQSRYFHITIAHIVL